MKAERTLSRTRPRRRNAEPREATSGPSRPEGLELLVELAHDLRSPISSILFLVDALQRGLSGELNPTQQRQVGLIYSAALRLCTVATDVIELVCGGDRLADREPELFSVQELLGSVRDMVRPLAEQKGVPVRLVVSAIELRLGHPRALSRVLLNLAINALKFVDEGFVEIAAEPKDTSRVVFSVRDTGPGIDAAALATLCEPFPLAGARRDRRFSRSGLGLAICHKLLTAMRSELQVETAPGRGTRFWFDADLPLARTPCNVLSAP